MKCGNDGNFSYKPAPDTVETKNQKKKTKTQNGIYVFFTFAHM